MMSNLKAIYENRLHLATQNKALTTEELDTFKKQNKLDVAEAKKLYQNKLKRLEVAKKNAVARFNLVKKFFEDEPNPEAEADLKIEQSLQNN